MTELPPGWTRARLGDLGRYVNGRGFKRSEWSPTGLPIIRIQNLTGTGESFNYYDGPVEPWFLASSGDILVSWAATLGVYVWRGGPAVVNQHIFKVESLIEPLLHRWLLEWQLHELRRWTQGSGMVHIKRRPFESTEVPLPPLDEQRRIVAAIEEQFSRLDAADRYLKAGSQRIGSLRRATLGSLTARLWPETWRRRTCGEVGLVQLGRQRSPQHHSGPSMRPYLRVANVFEDRIDTSDVMEMNFTDEEFNRYRLEYGDILRNEGQSPELVGRAAMFRDELPDVCFTNSLIRFRPHPEVDGRFALLVFRSHLHAGRFRREARITTNIAHLSAARFREVEFPLPTVQEQRAIVAETERRLSVIDDMERSIRAAQKRSGALRRAILDRAFRGELVPQDPSDEPASALLERIRRERTVAGTAPRRRVRSRAQ